MTPLDTSRQTDLLSAITKGDIIPAQLVSNPRDQINKPNQAVGFVIADGSKKDGTVATLVDPGIDRNSPIFNRIWSIRAGAYCIGDSGAALFLISVDGRLTNQIVAISSAFFPTEAANQDPLSADAQVCTNYNVIGTVLPNQ